MLKEISVDFFVTPDKEILPQDLACGSGGRAWDGYVEAMQHCVVSKLKNFKVLSWE